MRTILVDHARANLAEKRGGGDMQFQLGDVDAGEAPNSEELLDLDEALKRLSALDERAARVVELRWSWD